jgi:hypothetical protein
VEAAEAAEGGAAEKDEGVQAYEAWPDGEVDAADAEALLVPMLLPALPTQPRSPALSPQSPALSQRSPPLSPQQSPLRAQPSSASNRVASCGQLSASPPKPAVTPSKATPSKPAVTPPRAGPIHRRTTSPRDCRGWSASKEAAASATRRGRIDAPYCSPGVIVPSSPGVAVPQVSGVSVLSHPPPTPHASHFTPHGSPSPQVNAYFSPGVIVPDSRDAPFCSPGVGS